MTGARATLLGILLFTATAAAQPARVVYQGFLTDSGGDPVTDTVDLFFKMYPSETGGTQIWNETVFDVVISGGSFAVELSMSEADLTQDDLWLGMAIATAGQELPRMRVTSVPFALLGSDADGLGMIDASAYQRRMLGTCLVDQAIAAVNADGTVVCLDDDANGVGDIVAGLGLVQSGFPAVTLDVSPGEGLTILGDALTVDFDANGVQDLVARSDHGHPGAFLPAGMNMSCLFPQKVIGISSATGNVTCGPDASTSYAASNGLVMTPDGTGTYDSLLDTETSLSVSGITSGAFYISPSRFHRVSIDAADFRPSSSGFLDYFAAPGSGGYLTVPGTVDLLAGVPLPQGANMATFWMYYELVDGNDSIYCEIRSLNQFNVSDQQAVWTGFGAVGVGVLEQGGGIGGYAHSPVNNDQYVYFARCQISDQGAPGDVRLVGYTLEYEYSEMGR